MSLRPPVLTPTLATRFPLVPRLRPAARPLDERAARLSRLAQAAADEHDPVKASQVINGATLVASDCGAHGLARDWCRVHALLYLDQAPLDQHASYFVMEPLVNLARLRIRAGDGGGAHHILIGLYEAYTSPQPVALDGIFFHAETLIPDPAQRDRLREWVRTVLLSDGTRALLSIGAWKEAVAQLFRLDGLGSDLHDGRQVAVVAALLDGDVAEAADLLDAADVAEPWQKAVRAFLSTMCQPAMGYSLDQLLALTETIDLPEPGHTTFRTRLALTAIDLADQPPNQHARDLLDHVVADVIAASDGTSARELLAHPAPTRRQRDQLTRLVHASGLDLKALPEAIQSTLLAAMTSSASTIRHRGQPS